MTELSRIEYDEVILFMVRTLIGEKIKASGLLKGYIAKELNVNPNTVSNWIKGKSFPKLDQAYRLAKLIGCELNDLIDD